MSYRRDMSTQNSPKGRWVTDAELAEILGIHRQTLRNWRARDLREKRPEGDQYGGVRYRRWGDCVRYWLPREIDPTPPALPGGEE